LKSQSAWREYTDDYKRLCYQSWYNGGRPNSPTETRKLIPEDAHGRKPNARMIAKWISELMWHERADELDAKAIILSDDALVIQKANMLKRQSENAVAIAEKAKKHIITEEFDSSASAVNAYFRATEEERLTKGIGDMIIKMSKMNNTDLMDEISKRVKRAEESGQIIDAEPVENTKEDTPEEDDMTP